MSLKRAVRKLLSKRDKSVLIKESKGPVFVRHPTEVQAETTNILSFGPQNPTLGMIPHAPEIRNSEALRSKYFQDSIQATSMARFMDETFNPYRFSKFRELYKYSEPSFYKDYQESYFQNPFTYMVITFLLNEIFANGIHFEGPGANVVSKFFEEDGTWEKIRLTTQDALLKGNGFMDFTTKNGKLKRTRVIIPDYVQVVMDQKTGVREYWDGLAQKRLNEDNFGHLLFKEFTGVAYGMSLLRPNYVFLQALMDVSGDIVAAMKRAGYSPIIIRMDLEGVKDDEKILAMQNYKTKLEEIQSATNNFIIDKKHEVGLLGQGSAGARMLPTNDMLMPILSVVLFGFGVPLGLFLQTGANKSIIDEQRKAMLRFYEDLRSKLSRFISLHVIPKITKRECRIVFNNPPHTTDETQKTMATHAKLFELGLISREYFMDFWNLEDGGKTFYDPPDMGFGDNNGSREA